MRDYGKIVNFSHGYNEIEIQFERQRMIVTALTDEIINVFVPTWSEDHRSKAIEEEDYDRIEERGIYNFDVSQAGEDRLSVTTGAIKVIIGDGGYVDFYDIDGNALSLEYRGERKSRKILNMWDMELLKAEGHDISSYKESAKPVEDVRVIGGNEPIYGLGDKSGLLDKRSYEYEGWNSDDPSAHTEQFRSLYKSIPFLICKKPAGAYGLFYDNTFHTYHDLGKENPEYMVYSADDGNLDYYFMSGGTIPAVISNYMLLTGRAPLPQRWTLG